MAAPTGLFHACVIVRRTYPVVEVRCACEWQGGECLDTDAATEAWTDHIRHVGAITQEPK